MAAGMDSVTTSAGLLSTALGDLAAAGAGFAVFDVGIKNKLFDLIETLTGDTQAVDKMREKYGKLGGTFGIVSDSASVLKNTLQGYGATVDGTDGVAKALEKAMEDIANGAILTDQHMAELQNRFSLTDEDMEMLRQEMLDTNPLLREFADNMGFENASAETLEDIAQGFRDIANGAEPTPLALQNMTDAAQNFFAKVAENESVMDSYREKLESIGSVAENASEQLNLTGKSISDGITKGMEEADVEAGSENLFSRIIGKVKELFGIHSPSTVMAGIGHNIIEGLLNGLKDMWGSITSWITDKIQWLKEKLSGIAGSVKSAFTGGGETSSGYSRTYSMSPPTPYAVHPAIAKLSNIEIPQLATGAVLPANREFLALVGDQKHGTNVEAPLDTIKQALREEAVSLGLIGKNETPDINLNLTVECAGYQLINIMQKLDSEYFKQTGRHALA